MSVVVIAAVAKNGVIGREGALPWHLRADLKSFKERTLDKPMIMGRKTWESLPGLLKRRTHVVITRNGAYEAEGAIVVGSFAAALEAAEAGHADEVCVVGGSEIYALALPEADELLITHVDAEVEGDALFPEVDWHRWEGEEVLRQEADEHNDHPFRVVRYRRRQ